MFRIDPADLDDPRVIALVRRHVARAHAESGAANSAHALDLAGLKASEVRVWTLWDFDTPVGIGALKLLSQDHGEVKSMYTAETARRRGAARAMLRHIIAEACVSGLSRLSLETGSWPYFGPARALYAGHGFEPCPPFGDYVLDPNSVFMTLNLEKRSA